MGPFEDDGENIAALLDGGGVHRILRQLAGVRQGLSGRHNSRCQVSVLRRTYLDDDPWRNQLQVELLFFRIFISVPFFNGSVN